MDDGSVKMVDKDVIQMRNNVMDAGLEVMVVVVVYKTIDLTNMLLWNLFGEG